MSEVTLQVGGRPYTVSCADGEEDHVRHLAGIVDGKLAAMGANRVPGDAKNLLFAALILADEADEARRVEPLPPRRCSKTACRAGSRRLLAGSSKSRKSLRVGRKAPR